jgi:hypothetical protein
VDGIGWAVSIKSLFPSVAELKSQIPNLSSETFGPERLYQNIDLINVDIVLFLGMLESCDYKFIPVPENLSIFLSNPFCSGMELIGWDKFDILLEKSDGWNADENHPR